MKKILALVLALVLMMSAASVAFAADNSLDKIKSAGVLKLGLDVGFAPMGFYEEGTDNIIGFDIDLAAAVCEELGVTLELVPIAWDAKELELNGGNIDCIWNGMSITPAREASMTMSDAYLNNCIVLLVAEGTAEKKEDLAGKVVGVQNGSLAEEVLNGDQAEYAATLGEIVGYEDYVAAIMDLKNGNLDAVAIDDIVANYQIQVMGLEGYTIIDPLSEDLYGVGFRKGDYMLCGAVEEALLDMAEDGTLAEISTKWFGSDVALIGK